MWHRLVLESPRHAGVGPGELVVGEGAGHEPLPREAERHAGGVAGDPAPTPLLRDISGGAGAASWVEHEVAWISGHEQAALYNLRRRLHHVRPVQRSPYIHPRVVKDAEREVLEISFIDSKACARDDSALFAEPQHAIYRGLPIPCPTRIESDAVPIERDARICPEPVRDGGVGREHTGLIGQRR